MLLTCQALLFDLDGTLIDSIESVNRAWAHWAESHGLESDDVLHRIHGRRSIDSVAMILPDCDPVVEDAKLRAYECTDTKGIVALPGALEFLSALPEDRWGIVTSGASDVASARLRAVGMPKPGVLVCGDHVEFGKPHPEAFLRGAEGLCVDPKKVIGFEDTLAGVTAIVAAGMRALAMGGEIEGATYLGDFSRIRFLGHAADELSLELAD